MPKSIQTLLEGIDGLSPEFMTKVSAITEATIKERSATAVATALTEAEATHAEAIATLTESHALALSEAETRVHEEFAPHLNTFLENVVQKWGADNAVAIDSKLKTEMAANFLGQLGDMFTEANVELPEASNIVENYDVKVASLTEELDQTKAQLLESQSQLKESARAEAIDQIVEGLSDTSAERVRQLTEGDSFDDPAAFKARAETYRAIVEGEKTDDDKDEKADGDKLVEGEKADDEKAEGDDGEKADDEKGKSPIKESVDCVLAEALKMI